MEMTDAMAMPSLLDLNNVPTNTMQRIDTDVLDPVVINDNFARFTLSNKGFLNHNSRIVLGLSVATQKYLPLNVGIDALIERAVLKFNNKEISEINDFAHLSAIKAAFLSPQFNKEREQFVSGKTLAHTIINGSDNEIATTGTQNQGNFEVIDNGFAVKFTGANQDNQKVRSELKFDTNAKPTFSILLADLFPFFAKQKSFPLYVCKDQINIELHFAKSINRANSVDNATAGDAIKIDTNAVKFVADYFFYEQEIMDAQAAKMNSGNGTQWGYIDYRLSKMSTTKAKLEAGTIRNIGGAGLRVSKIYSMLSNDITSNASQILNRYNSNFGNTGNINSINIKYNDKYLFTTDKKNPATIMHHLQEAGGSIPNLNKTEYSNNGVLFRTNIKIEKAELKGNLAGKMFYTGFNLTRNERINERGIEFEYKCTNIADVAYTQRVFLEIQRYAVLKDGHLDCYFY